MCIICATECEEEELEGLIGFERDKGITMCIICLDECKEKELIKLERGSGTYYVCVSCLGGKRITNEPVAEFKTGDETMSQGGVKI